MIPRLGPGPSAESERKVWSSREKIVLLLLLAGMLAYLGFVLHPWQDPKPDGSMYIITARSMAAGEGYTYLGTPSQIRPPGFSLMIAPILAIFGTSFAVLNLHTSLWGVTAIVLLFVYQRTRLGWPLALLVSLAVGLNPTYEQYCNQVMSDVPGTALFLACLLLERRAARSPSWRSDLVLGMAIGLAAYVRSITILLVPAVIVARLVQRILDRDRSTAWLPFVAGRLAVIAVSAWLVLLPWSLRNQFRAPPPPADQTMLYDYSTAMFHADRGDPGSRRLTAEEILRRVPLRAVEVAAGLSSRLQSPSGAFHPGPAFLMIVCALYVLFKRRAASDLFVMGSLGVLLVYFAFQDRLLLPIYMLILSATVEAARDLFRVAMGRRATAWVLTGALVLLIGFDLAPRAKWKAIAAWSRDHEALCSIVATGVSAEARLASGTGWHFNVCLERPVFGLKHAFRRTGKAKDVEAVIDKYGVDTVFLVERDLIDRALLPYFLKEYGSTERVGPITFVKVRPRPVAPAAD